MLRTVHYYSNHTPTPSSSSSNNSRSKFREHLSIQLPTPTPMHEIDLQVSRFSPESPPPPPFRSPSPAISGLRSFSPMGKSYRSAEKGKEREKVVVDVEAAITMSNLGPSRTGGTPRWGWLKEKINHLFFDARVPTFAPGFGREKDGHHDYQGRDADFVIPIQHPHSRSHSPSTSHTFLPSWPPLHVSKRHCTCHDNDERTPKQKKRDKQKRSCFLLLVIILLLYLLGSSTFSLIRVLSLSPSPSTSTSSSSSGSSASASASLDVQQCISQYTLNAPTSPPSYPCATCLPILSTLPSSTISSLSTQDAQSANNAVQFCALRAIFDDSDSDGQTALGNGRWDEGVKFCAWSGVVCDGSGRVSSLQLTFPGTPASLPASLGTLTDLQSLTIIGNGAIPGGALPDSFANLTGLTALHLESTGLSGLPDGLFAGGEGTGLEKIQTLELVKNVGMGGGSLPSSLFGSGLQNLVINGQALNGATLQSITNSTSLQSSLLLLDLSTTPLTTTLPSTLPSLTSLTELHLDSTNLQPPLPAQAQQFPPKLQVLSLSNNTALGAGGTGGVCTIQGLTSCDLQGDGLSAPTGGCGVCSF